MPTVRRWVEMPRGKPGKGGHPRTFAYGYPEIAALAGITEGSVRNASARRAGPDGRLLVPELDPASLESVLRFVLRRRPDLAAEVKPRRRARPG
jgi:hypothetical protein